MLRHGNDFACAALMATLLAIPSSPGAAQATAPAPANQQAATPKAQTTVTAPGSTTKPRVHHKKAVAVAEVPPPPPTLEQQPPTAPQVMFRNGQLTIDASNSTLSSILRAVQVQTGASMDVPSAAGSERVAMRLGPGAPRDVLHTLLNGSKFDYMILGVAGNPGAIQKVILTPKQAIGATTQASNNPQPPSDDQDEGTPVADTGGESEYPGPSSEQPPMPPGAIRRPMGAPGGQQFQQNNNPQQNPFGQGNSDNVVKTPEQLMQELQEMQQQQQQYQDQLNPANQNPQQ
jgi:hypothetical protein